MSQAHYPDTASQGYVTGHAYLKTNANTSLPFTHAIDRFIINPDSDSTTTHIFETYIMSSIAQTIRLRSGGDDGHSIFVDDVFGDGAGYAVTADTDLAMLAGEQYKLTLVLNNAYGPWSMWFHTTDAAGVVSAASDASNISMNAAGNFAPVLAPVPEPATMLLFGLGLLGLAGANRRKE